MSPRTVRIALYILIPFVILVVSTGWILEWLWMDNLGYVGIFWTLKLAKATLLAAAFVVSAVFITVNLRILADRLRSATFIGTPLEPLNLDLARADHHKRLKQFLTVAGIVMAFLFALSFSVRWDESIRFVWHMPFGESDPVFGRDIGFYLFQLPFWELVQTSLTVLVFFVTAFLVAIYFFGGLVRMDGREGLVAHPMVMNQIKTNAVIWLLLLAGGLFLDRYQLLFRRDGLVFGAGYTDVHVELPAIWVTLIMVLVLAVLVALSRWMNFRKLIAVTSIATLVVWIGGRALLPAVIQNFNVEPNELELETPFIEHNIRMTRMAYKLDAVREVEYEADDTLSITDIRNNQDAVDNIRLWDPRLLIQTYKQLQEIRSYYEFYSVDNDRYEVDGDVTQMMLSAREIAPNLPGQSNTWVNRHLQFTHGYGLAMSPVTETDQQGEPVLAIRDLPPRFESDDLAVENAAIYYGEASSGYNIVNTGTPELHYPAGDENVYIHYDGVGGIPFSNWFRQLLFAWELGDINILLSDYIQPDSRLQIWRSLQDRIRRITPFLELDRDPYLVLDRGGLYWIQDAYTIASNFPYAQPFENHNYIRNSVKIVVDAYNGTVDYYIVDADDPVLKVYDAIFPNVFKPIEEIPVELERQFRYPQDLFEIQLEVYNRYHMTGPQVFYNNEDLWERPIEKYGGAQQLMAPYYVLARLPEQEDLAFMLISPLTPANRDNMISWMAAMSDPGEYGQLVVYKLPKQRLIYGPAQIEARIDQDPEISTQVALWDQRGSRVIRGNLMVIPIESSFLYVEPVFLLAEDVDIPQLQRVIVAIGDDLAMQPTMDEALFDLFGDIAAPVFAEAARGELATGDPTEDVAMVDSLVQEVTNRELAEIRSTWREVRQALETGNWGEYGDLMTRLEDLIED